MSTRETMIEVEDVVKDFRPGFGLVRKRALHGISFSLREGELFGFVGPNGAGKTTTLKILLGLIHADGGHTRILGRDVTDTAVRRHVGFLPENPYFYDYLTGREFLEFYARVSGVPKPERGPRIARILEDVGLSHAADARLRTYSKGMLQRIGIAQAIVHDPAIVFLDEPMSGLDPIGRKEIRDLILRLNREGKTILMNTHILTDVEMLCDRVAILVKGRIRFEGSVEEVLPSGRRETDVVLGGIDPEGVLQCEERFGAEVRGQGERVELRVAEKDVPGLLRVALDRGAEVLSVMPHRASLESIFLHAVHEGDEGQEESR